MRKTLYLFTAFLLVLTSCSSDEKDAPATSILPKTYTYGYNNTTKIAYSGNKIVSIVDSDGGKTTFVYEGDVISKEQRKGETFEYTYSNGKLSSSIEGSKGDTYENKIIYSYNTDGTVSFDEFIITNATGVEEKSLSGKYTFKDGNLIKKEISHYNGLGPGEIDTYEYEYDTKNGAFKNVLGGYNLFTVDRMIACVNNVVKEKDRLEELEDRVCDLENQIGQGD